jgi:hypothetical protein
MDRAWRVEDGQCVGRGGWIGCGKVGWTGCRSGWTKYRIGRVDGQCMGKVDGHDVGRLEGQGVGGGDEWTWR